MFKYGKIKFNSEKACEHVKNISFPRAPGSEGEKKARDYIKGCFESFGLKTEMQEFTYSIFPLKVIARLFLLTLICIKILIYILYDKYPLLSVILSLTVVILIIISTKWRKSYHRFYNIPLDLKTSWNIIARKYKSSNSKNLIFLAHYDSKSQTLPAFWRALIFGTAFFGSGAMISGTLIFSLLKYLGRQPVWDKTALFYICIITVSSYLLLQLNRSGNKSPGSLDNASGIGVLLELARSLGEEMKNTNLTFIATGAEEDGLCGAIRFMETYSGDYDKENSYFINFDGPGAEGNIIITSRYAIPPVYTGGLLSPLACKIAGDEGYDIIKGYIPLGAGLDQFPVSIYGFPVITIASGKICSKIIFAIHTENDTLDLISEKALGRCGNLTYKMALNIDKYF